MMKKPIRGGDAAVLVVFILVISCAMITMLAQPAAAKPCNPRTQHIQCGSQMCNKTTRECDFCSAFHHCTEFYSGLGCYDGHCLPRPLDQTEWYKTLGSVLIGASVCAIAVIAGVGGGGILVPLYSIVLGVPVVNAVALSQATIAGQAFLNVIVQLPRFHPKHSPPRATRPLINYEYLSLLLPNALVGVVWGKMLSEVAPDWLRVVLLIALCSALLVKSSKRVKNEMAKMKAAKKKAITEAREQLQKEEHESGSPGTKEATEVALAKRQRALTRRLTRRMTVIVHGDPSPAAVISATRARGQSRVRSPSRKAAEGGNGEDALLVNGDEGREDQEMMPKAADDLLDSLGIGRGDADRVGTNGHLGEHEAAIKRRNSVYSDSDFDTEDEFDLIADYDDVMIDAAAAKRTVLKNKAKSNELLPQYPPVDLAIIITDVVVFLLCNAVRSRGTECGGGYYFLMAIVPSIFLWGTFLSARQRLQIRRQAIADGQCSREKLPFQWSTASTVVCPLLAFFAGAGAAVLGIGGGLVLSFLLFEAGLAPEEASATSGITTFFVALGGAVLYATSGDLKYDSGLVFFAGGLLATVVGQKVFMAKIRANGWHFLIIGSLCFVIVGSLLCLGAFGIADTVAIAKAGGSLGFGELCP